MNYQDSKEKLAAYQGEIRELRKAIREVQLSREAEAVDNYTFTATEGSVSLTQLFGDKDTLFIVHNMGKDCSYCTLWADGFNGVADHLQSRAAFVVSSPDSPDVQREFAASRNWRFRMVSHQDTTFADDMGYKSEGSEGGFWPGVSVFKKDGDGVRRVSDTSFGPGDDFCGVWHLLDLIPEGADGWQPKYSY
ncbi:MAG: DUF899 family protein [Gammaproteobacteria bacterium]|nr:DUF899 family protein [Gammaproteobacteria bacterium]